MEHTGELQVARSLYVLLHSTPMPDGLQVKPSNIPGAGQGLFAAREFEQGEVLCAYTGVVYPSREAWKRPDKSYLMKLGGGKYVDALHSPEVLARYINDCRGHRGGFNVQFDKRPEENKANVVAMRDIRAGEELYVNYGRMYWLAYNLMHPDSPVR